MNIGNRGKQKALTKLSEYYDTQRMKTLAEIIHHKETDDPRINITIDKHTLKINEYNTKRIGRPKFAWWIHAMDDLWLTYQKSNEAHRYTPMNLDNPDHIELVKQTAKQIVEEQHKKKKNDSYTDSTNNTPNSTTTTTATTSTTTKTTTHQNTDIPGPETNTNNNDTNTKFIYSHTITNIQETHSITHATDNTKEQLPKSNPEENNNSTTFKQQLQRHKAYNNTIIKKQLSCN